MTTTSSVIDLTDTKATAGSQTSRVEDDTYATVKVRTTGAGSIFLMASEGVFAGNPWASSTRKKDSPNGDLSMQATKGSQDNSPVAGDKGASSPLGICDSPLLYQSHVEGTGRFTGWARPHTSPT